MMIRITDTPKPRDRFGSIPIRDDQPTNSFPPGPHPPRPRKTSFFWTWLWRLAGALLGLTLLLGLGSFFLVPSLATTLLAGQLSSVLNRPVTIPRAEFNPLTCTLTLHNLIVGPKLSKPNDPVDPLFSVGRMSIDCEPKRLLDGEVACSLKANHCFLHLVRQKDGGYNLGQTMADLLPGMPVLPLRISCNTISLSNSRLVFDDEQTGKTHLAEEIALDISPGAKGPGPAALFHLQTTINGTAITINDMASLTGGPGQTPNLRPAMPDSTQPGGDTPASGAPEDPAVNTAEAISLVQDLAQAVRQSLQYPGNPPVEPRPENPLP